MNRKTKDIFTASSLEELKKCGKLADVRVVYKKKADSLGFKGRTNSWAAMFDSIQALSKAIEDEDEYFKSKAAKTIFYLLESMSLNPLHFSNGWLK